MDLIKKVVKVKKLQKVGTGLCVIIPKKWIEEMNWNQLTRLTLEFLPHRKTMILSQADKQVKFPTGEKIEQKDTDFIPV